MASNRVAFLEGQRPRCPQTMNDISVWWSLKVICGLLLVSNQAVYFSFSYPEILLPVPILLSQLLVISGAAVFFTHFILLKKANPLLNQPDHLVQNQGLFKRIRHPMYLGEMILDVGLASFCLHPLSLCILATALLALYRQAVHEDHLLGDRFGIVFTEWKEHTGLLLPHHL